jgi:hypothetical protein
MLSFESQNGFDKRATHLNEREYQDMARAVKELARELGQDPALAIDQLVRGGLDKALSALTLASGSNALENYQRRTTGQQEGWAATRH